MYQKPFIRNGGLVQLSLIKSICNFCTTIHQLCNIRNLSHVGMQPCVDDMHGNEAGFVFVKRYSQLPADFFQTIVSQSKFLRKIIVNGVHQRIDKIDSLLLPFDRKTDMIGQADHQRLFQHFL